MKANPNLEALTQKAQNMVATVPMQQVIPVGAAYEPEAQLNVRVPQSLVKRLKQKSLDDSKSIQQMIKEAVDKYLQ